MMKDSQTRNDVPHAVVVNDDATQRFGLTELLRQAGVEARGYASSEAALSAMDPANPPDLIVTDVYMPGIDGWQFCRLLRSDEYAAFSRTPILVVSAVFSGEEPDRIATEIGADAFLAAPVDGTRFMEQAQALLRREKTLDLPRILIVEDQPAEALVLQKRFEAAGYRADTAGTIQEAAERFSRSAYDVSLIDYHLPDGEGDTLLDMFIARRPECVCLMMTVDSAPERALNWMKHGAAAYLHKPFDPPYGIELCARARRERTLMRAQEQLDVRTRELRESEERLRQLSDNLPNGVVYQIDSGVDGTERRFTYLSGGVERLHEVSAAAAMQNPMLIYGQVLEDDRRMVAEREAHAAATMTPLQVEVRAKTPSGVMRWLSFSSAPRRLANGRLVWDGIETDITARKRMEEERDLLQAQLTQAQKMEMVGRLAGGVAHDFNNMLQTIVGNTELALDRVAPDDPLRTDLLEIQKAADRSANLARQLLAFARKQTVAPKLLDMNETVEGMLKMLRRLIGEDIELVWRPGARIWPVYMDPSQIDQILANLCVNARDAITGVGRLIIETRNVVFDADSCRVHPDCVAGDYVAVEVSDNGSGMDRETLARLFEPFFTTKESGKGTGLGLSTIYGIVKQNNGFISVYSEPGQGTTFKIHLPCHRGAAEKPEPASAPVAFARGRETILLVEDEPSILLMTSTMLRRLDYNVLSAGSPDEALRLARAHTGPIHLLMTDVVMPEMNGRDLADRLLAIQPRLHRLFMSGYTADVIAHHGVLDPGVQFIQKPFTKHDLASKVRAALDSGRDGAG